MSRETTKFYSEALLLLLLFIFLKNFHSHSIELGLIKDNRAFFQKVRLKNFFNSIYTNYASFEHVKYICFFNNRDKIEINNIKNLYASYIICY